MFATIKAFFIIMFSFRVAPTHYVRCDMNNIVFTSNEYVGLVKNNESIVSKLVAAKRVGKGMYVTIVNGKASGVYKV